MIKYYLVCGFFFSSLVLFGQEYEFKEPKDIKMKVGMLDSYYQDSIKIGDTISMTYYNDIGKMIKTISRYNGRIASISNYKYDTIGQLIEYKDYGRQSYQILTDPKTGKEIEKSIWDSTTVMQIKKYQYESGLLKRTDEYLFGNILEYSSLFDYDMEGRIIRELNISYPDENTLVYFKPNSSEIDWNHPKQTKIETYTKECKYLNKLRICSFSDSSGFKSSDTSTYKNGLIIKSIGYDTNRRFLYEDKYVYNLKFQLMEYSANHSNYGGEFDMLAANRYIYNYDQEGFLISEELYDKNDLLQRYYYKLIRK